MRLWCSLRRFHWSDMAGDVLMEVEVNGQEMSWVEQEERRGSVSLGKGVSLTPQTSA